MPRVNEKKEQQYANEKVLITDFVETQCVKLVNDPIFHKGNIVENMSSLLQVYKTWRKLKLETMPPVGPDDYLDDLGVRNFSIWLKEMGYKTENIAVGAVKRKLMSKEAYDFYSKARLENKNAKYEKINDNVKSFRAELANEQKNKIVDTYGVPFLLYSKMANADCFSLDDQVSSREEYIDKYIEHKKKLKTSDIKRDLDELIVKYNRSEPVKETDQCLVIFDDFNVVKKESEDLEDVGSELYGKTILYKIKICEENETFRDIKRNCAVLKSKVNNCVIFGNKVKDQEPAKKYDIGLDKSLKQTAVTSIVDIKYFDVYIELNAIPPAKKIRFTNALAVIKKLVLSRLDRNQVHLLPIIHEWKTKADSYAEKIKDLPIFPRLELFNTYVHNGAIPTPHLQAFTEFLDHARICDITTLLNTDLHNHLAWINEGTLLHEKLINLAK